jgi:tRNA (guanine-N7-)-methyltransferase
MDPQEYIVTRKRKKYKFALYANSPLCFEVDEWVNEPKVQVLEMGAGTGLFSVALARQMPDKQHVAVDVKADRLQTGAYQAASEGLTNLRFLRARADQLRDLLAPHSLASIWVTFPDPFPKKRSAKHRLTHPQYLKLYAELLAVGGALYFKTDAKDLFTWSLEQLVSEGWIIKELTFDLHESSLPDSYKVKTTYETRYTGEGLKIHFVKAMPPM